MIIRRADTRLMRIFSANMRRRRVELDWSQGRLAAECGLKQDALSHLESGDRLPSLTSAYKIAKALGCNIDDMVCE